MTELERKAVDALHYAIRWRLDGEPCWCQSERRVEWREGRKIHTRFCRTAAEAYGMAQSQSDEWLGALKKTGS